jgi:hypothetical protein
MKQAVSFIIPLDTVIFIPNNVKPQILSKIFFCGKKHICGKWLGVPLGTQDHTGIQPSMQLKSCLGILEMYTPVQK